MAQPRLAISIAAAMLALAALSVASGAARADQPSGNSNDSDNTPWNRRLDDARVDEIRLHTDRYDTVTQIVVVTTDCAFRSDTRAITRRNVNRLGFTQDIPLIGGLFENTPRQGQLNESNRLGLAFLEGEVLYVDIRPEARIDAGDHALLAQLSQGPTGAATADFTIGNGGPAPTSVSVVNRDFEYVLQPGGFTALAPAGYRCDREGLSGLPALGPLFDKPLGTAHLLGGRLIVLIKPSIIAGY